MISNTIKQIADALATLFPLNLFLINEDGIIQWVNEHMLKAANQTELKAIQGKHVRMFGEKEWLTTKSVITSKEKSILFEDVCQKNFFTIKIPHSEDGFRGVIGLSFDITALRKAEVAKQTFLTNMSHDLRTPLTGILGLAEIQAELGTQAQDKEYGVWIYQAGKQLLELLTAVLDICALENPVDLIKKEEIDLTQFVNEIRELMEPSMLNKGLSFHVKRDMSLRFIFSDSIKLKRVLVNLLSNAVKFTHEGEITLAIKWLDLTTHTQIEMQVIDTGIGIPEDKLDKVFDRFYRVDSSYRTKYLGNGLGLSLVKESLEQLGGSIKVTSQEGKGSCFTITLDVL